MVSFSLHVLPEASLAWTLNPSWMVRFLSSVEVAALLICCWEDSKCGLYLLMLYEMAFQRFLVFFCVAEEQAPPSSCLVQRLLFQFIESQGSWQEKCPTLHYLPQVTFQGNSADTEKKPITIFCHRENRAEHQSTLMKASGMQTKICFRNILRCEGKCLSLKAGVLKAGIYLKKTFFFPAKKKKKNWAEGHSAS